MTLQEPSVAFDRPAEYHDRPRAIPPEELGVTSEMFAGQLRARGRCLRVVRRVYDLPS